MVAIFWCLRVFQNGLITSPHAKSTSIADQRENEVPETSRKGARRKESGSQTEDNEVNESCGGCHNTADTIIEMNRKLDLVLARMEEIGQIKEKPKQLEKANADLVKSLEFAYDSIKFPSPNWSFSETLFKPEFPLGRKYFRNEAFENDGATIIMWFTCPSFRLTQIQCDRWLLRFQISMAQWWSKTFDAFSE